MKTFSEFIAEAENVSSQIAALRAKARQAMQKGDMETFKKLNVQAGELQAGTQAKIGAATSDKPKPQTKPNSYVGGYASKPKDVASRVGTTSNVQRTDLPAEPDVITQHRYAKKGTAGGRGTNIARSGRTYGTKGRGG
jgi:hypothetical protein